MVGNTLLDNHIHYQCNVDYREAKINMKLRLFSNNIAADYFEV